MICPSCAREITVNTTECVCGRFFTEADREEAFAEEVTTRARNRREGRPPQTQIEDSKEL